MVEEYPCYEKQQQQQLRNQAKVTSSTTQRAGGNMIASMHVPKAISTLLYTIVHGFIKGT